jgi:6-pyruvoyltetrahydropterin/6-carboxytetrahydropterin synthase
MKVTVSRKGHFNAAHRLYRKDWTDSENEIVFGKCSNPFYHGHNYELIVSVKGEVDPETGYVIDIKKLKNIIKFEIEDYMDHKNLNQQVVEFANLNPTAENIAVVIYNRLLLHIEKEHSLSITLYETPKNFVTFSG